MTHSRRNRTSQADIPHDGRTQQCGDYSSLPKSNDFYRSKGIQVGKHLVELGESIHRAPEIVVILAPTLVGNNISVTKEEVRAALQKIRDSESR